MATDIAVKLGYFLGGIVKIYPAHSFAAMASVLKYPIFACFFFCLPATHRLTLRRRDS
jgi:hypothetical protein